MYCYLGNSTGGLCVALCKVIHEVDQGIYGLLADGIVNGRSHSTDGAMAFEIGQAGGLAFLEKPDVKIRIGQQERNVHA